MHIEKYLCIGENSDVHIVGRLDKSIYSCMGEEFITDEVIITNEQLQHIKERHPKDYQQYFKYVKEIVEAPDYIIRDLKPNTGFLLKKIIDKDKRFQLILKIIEIIKIQ